MKCPKCNKGVRVIETRQHVTGVIRRRRACSGCGHRFTTEERIIFVSNRAVGRSEAGRSSEAALEIARMRRIREAEARRRIEELDLMKELGLTEDEELYDG